MQKTNDDKPKGPTRKTDAASLIHRYVSVAPATARAIAAKLPASQVEEIERGASAARVNEIVNLHLAASDKATADAQPVGETAE